MVYVFLKVSSIMLRVERKRDWVFNDDRWTRFNILDYRFQFKQCIFKRRYYTTKFIYVNFFFLLILFSSLHFKNVLIHLF